jgi:hypothetical protein
LAASNDTIRSTSRKEKAVERTIHDILNDFLLSKLAYSAFHEEAKKVREISIPVALYYSERIDSFGVPFHIAFFSDLREKVQHISEQYSFLL